MADLTADLPQAVRLQRLVASGSEDTLISRAHSGKPCRVVRSEWIDAWEADGSPAPLKMPLQQVLTGDVFASLHEHGEPRLIYEAAGQSVFGIDGETCVADQMRKLVREMDEAWDCLAALSRPAAP